METDWTQFQVQAIPLFTLLSAINLTTIDFLSLDVEGAEYDILKTIPIEIINITVFKVLLFGTPLRTHIFNN